MAHLSTHNLPLAELDRRSFFHPFTALAEHQEAGPIVMHEGKGVSVRDLDGRQYLDAAAGLWCVNIGYGRAEVAEAIYRQALRLPFFHSFGGMGNEPTIRLSDRLLGLAPPGMARVFFGNSGSDANDTNVKLVWHYNILRGKPQKLKIISRRMGYHGVTVAAGSLTGLTMVHRAFNLPLPEMRHVSFPDLYRGKPEDVSERDYSRSLAGELRAMIEAEGPETVAAFIAEPIMGTGGVLVPPEGYFEEIQAVLDEHDVLMIADEVICGFGRLGAWFGSQVLGIRPDIMTIAKGLTSGYVPMSGSIVAERIWDVLMSASPSVGPFAHGFTYSAHPVAGAAAMANLDIIEGEDLVGNAARAGAHLQRRARECFADHPLVGDIRGLGLMIGFELVEDKTSRRGFDLARRVGPRVLRCCLAEGLIVRALPEGNTISMSPPLCITAAEIDDALARFGRALDVAAGKLREEGIWSG